MKPGVVRGFVFALRSGFVEGGNVQVPVDDSGIYHERRDALARLMDPEGEMRPFMMTLMSAFADWVLPGRCQ